MSMKRLSETCVVCICAVVFGCRGSEDINVYPVTGVVTLNGKPLGNASIIFNPAMTPSLGRLATARTDQQGKFTLYTENRRGAGVCSYTVTVIAEEESAERPDPRADRNAAASSTPGKLPISQKPGKLRVPEMYTKQEESGLTFTVLNESNHFEIKLTSEPAK